MRVSEGLPCHAGSAKRLSPLGAASAERPSVIDANSRTREPAQDVTVSRLPRQVQRKPALRDVGHHPFRMPAAELVGNKSSGTAIRPRLNAVYFQADSTYGLRPTHKN